MTDELDKASGLEMADRERALNALLNRVKESPDTRVTATTVVTKLTRNDWRPCRMP